MARTTNDKKDETIISRIPGWFKSACQVKADSTGVSLSLLVYIALKQYVTGNDGNKEEKDR